MAVLRSKIAESPTSNAASLMSVPFAIRVISKGGSAPLSFGARRFLCCLEAEPCTVNALEERVIDGVDHGPGMAWADVQTCSVVIWVIKVMSPDLHCNWNTESDPRPTCETILSTADSGLTSLGLPTCSSSCPGNRRSLFAPSGMTDSQSLL
ncbi:hypothetical protein E4T56_gene5995 [Termitomyces sp. T112]|nr:hypothetical protein E4T56_gene5995 [Termitomyces sp. T112]